MKFICNRKELTEAVTKLHPVISQRMKTLRPTLAHIKLEATNDMLRISATDLEICAHVTATQIQIERAGIALLPCDELRAVLNNCRCDNIYIDHSQDEASIRSDDALFVVPTLSPDEFPLIPAPLSDCPFSVTAKALSRAISLTEFAMDDIGAIFATKGIFFAIKNNRLCLVATDGRRLAISDNIDVIGDIKKEASAPISGRLFAVIKGMIDDPDELISLCISENQASFYAPSWSATGVLLEGQFPQYESVVPKDCTKKMTANALEFMAAIKSSAVFFDKENKVSVFDLSKKGLIVSGRGPINARSTVNFPCKYDGADLRIGFNAAFLIDALKIIGDEDVSIEFTDPDRPCLLKFGGDYKYVLIPTNLNK